MVLIVVNNLLSNKVGLNYRGDRIKVITFVRIEICVLFTKAVQLNYITINNYINNSLSNNMGSSQHGRIETIIFVRNEFCFLCRSSEVVRKHAGIQCMRDDVQTSLRAGRLEPLPGSSQLV